MDIKITGAEELKTYINKTIDYLKNPKKTFQQGSLAMMKDVSEHFTNEKGESGHWRPLSEITLKRRKKGGKSKYGDRILRDSGTLWRSIGADAGKDFMEVGSTIPYAAVHNYGYKKIPQRDFLWLSQTSIDRILNIIISGL